MAKSISVFFPAYNEAGNLEATVGKAVNVLQNLNLNWEILIINDGSTDDTARVASELVNKNPKVRVINHAVNGGYGEALKSGFYNAKNELIVYNDSDGQFDFGEVNKFLEKIDKVDLVLGYRIKRKDPFFRLLFAKGWALALFLFFGLSVKDVDCGFKMIRKAALEKIPKLESTRGGMINAELTIRAKKAGLSIAQVGVHHYPRFTGQPTGANISVIIISFTDLFKLWWKLRGV